MAELIAPKRLVIVGATGMVGGYALRCALDQPVVRGVTAIGRRPLAISHPKLKEVLHATSPTAQRWRKRSRVRMQPSFALERARVSCLTKNSARSPSTTLSSSRECFVPAVRMPVLIAERERRRSGAAAVGWRSRATNALGHRERADRIVRNLRAKSRTIRVDRAARKSIRDFAAFCAGSGGFYVD